VKAQAEEKQDLITLTSDFGLRDYFVGVMKGVLLQQLPAARLIDITHEIPRHDVLSAAFVLKEVFPYFPSGTIHLAVVDPGVGTARRKIILKTAGQLFVAPDNGILSYILQEKDCRTYAVENTPLFPFEKSATFAGRDHFAPITALLAKGILPEKLGAEVFDAKRIEGLEPKKMRQGLVGKIIYFDHFGNAVTNLSREILGERLENPKDLRAKLKGHSIRGLQESYESGQNSGASLMINSSGLLEVFLSCENAKKILNLHLMDEILMT